MSLQPLLRPSTGPLGVKLPVVFQSLNMRARGGKGMVLAVWREVGVSEELTLADLSDGTLRLLCWLALTLSPSIPRFLCIDEPEIGLHPRALPILAGALKLAAARAQLVIATHSPHLLSQFSLDDIAVIRRENGRAIWVRPPDASAPTEGERPEKKGPAGRGSSALSTEP